LGKFVADDADSVESAGPQPPAKAAELDAGAAAAEPADAADAAPVEPADAARPLKEDSSVPKPQ
jgi:hypothetical protein